MLTLSADPVKKNSPSATNFTLVTYSKNDVTSNKFHLIALMQHEAETNKVR
jgi:hypothetical protein